uniref:Variant surface glycoprotein 1125.5249 n=1 Tax=Trypanosoma brucei TaxID=5691 RepID=A0A1J0RC23_9TRYP|nr:variant surface glycoprotein 1125.5249 [Trypanosoma brucei]
MWKKVATLIVSVFLVVSHVSRSDPVLVNGKEFKTLCEFVGLTERINELLDKVKEKSEANVAPLQKRVKDILFGTDIGNSNEMSWQPYRQLDCGQDSGTTHTQGGKALARDIVCLCEGEGQQAPPGGLCYTGNANKISRSGWNNAETRGSTWNVLKNKCAGGREETAPTKSEFRARKKQLKGHIKERKDGKATEHLYTYGGGKGKGLHTCNGAKSENDGICVMYPRGSDEDNASGIEWLKKLEDLVGEVEEMNKDESASGSTKPSTDGKPSMEKKPKPNTKPSTGENSPAERSDESRENRNPNTQTTTSTETGLTTTRPPEEQKSSTKIILQSIWVFLFLLFV